MPRRSGANYITRPEANGSYVAPAASTSPGPFKLPFLNVKDYGATGDGVTDDAAAINAALTAAGAVSIPAEVRMPAGTYLFNSQIVIPAGVTLSGGQGAQLLCGVTGGGDAITIGNRATLRFEGYGSGTPANTPNVTTIATANIARLITNALHDGTQEYAYLRGANILCHSGATVTVALVDWVALFVNSGIADLVIGCNHTAPLGLRLAGGPSSGSGPVYVDNVWVLESTGDNILITENNPSQGACQFWLRNITSEHPASGHHAVNITGFGGLAAVGIWGVHTENGTVAAATSAGVYANGVANLLIDNWMVLASPIANKRGLWATNSGFNTRIVVRGISNQNNVNPIIRDDTGNGLTVAGVNVGEWCGPGYTWQRFGGQAFSPIATAAAPNYANGGMYFDATLNKLRIGGATAYETIDSYVATGTAVLAAGTIAVANASITANARIKVFVQTPGGAVGAPFVSAITAGVGFTITSTSGADTSTIRYEIESF